MTVYQEIFEVIKQRKADYEAGKAQENSSVVRFIHLTRVHAGRIKKDD
jgi:hypothetical protein